MKLPVVVLAGSLLANAALFTAFVFRPSLAPPKFESWFESGAARDERIAAERRDARADTPRVAAAEAGAQAKLWSELDASDVRALASRLRKAGFPPSVVRAVVAARITRQLSARFKALQAETANQPYWKATSTGMFDQTTIEERMQLMRERTRLLREALGDDLYDGTNMGPEAALRRNLGNLAGQKLELVRRINDDYADMAGEVRASMNGVTLPEDREKLAYLEREKQKDLAAVLSPDELADYEMRTSPITGRLRQTMSLMDASESEFRTIFNILKPYQDILYPSPVSGVFASATVEQRSDAMKQVNAEIVAALGETRGAEYLRDSNFEFQQLVRVTSSQNLPRDAAIQAFNIRNSTADQSERIGSDPNLSGDEKLAALRTLAQNTRSQLITTLGQAAGATYANSAFWLREIERGGIVSFNQNGATVRPIQLPLPRRN